MRWENIAHESLDRLEDDCYDCLSSRATTVRYGALTLVSCSLVSARFCTLTAHAAVVSTRYTMFFDERKKYHRKRKRVEQIARFVTLTKLDVHLRPDVLLPCCEDEGDGGDNAPAG